MLNRNLHFSSKDEYSKPKIQGWKELLTGVGAHTVITAFERMRQEDRCDFKISLDYRVNSRAAWTTQ